MFVIKTRIVKEIKKLGYNVKNNTTFYFSIIATTYRYFKIWIQVH